jgi:hypothetical protein
MKKLRLTPAWDGLVLGSESTPIRSKVLAD